MEALVNAAMSHCGDAYEKLLLYSTLVITNNILHMIYQQMALYYIRNMFLLILSVWGGPKIKIKTTTLYYIVHAELSIYSLLGVIYLPVTRLIVERDGGVK